ncbi:MAG TPA: hypothetical protein VGO71_04415 [Baekduia sp.]|jgi:hypothetical protein|nr:hypothetical protein [Baekduia sp.]
MRRRLLLALLTLAAGLASAPGANAQGVIDAAARALASDPVYVAPGAKPSLTADEAAALRRRIERGDAGPVYIAILPASAVDEAGGDPAEVVSRLATAVGRRGTYAAISGGRFRAGSYTVSGAGRAASAALAAHRDEGVAAVLNDWIDRVAQARADAGSGGSGGSGSGGGSGTGLLVVLGVLGGGALLATSVSRRRRRREEQRQLDDLRTAARDDLVALGEDVRDVDLDIEMPGADPRARDELGSGLEAYERAERLLDQARRPEDIAEVTRTVDDGRQAMAACRALLDGHEPPPRRPPCFFDPRHGPSVTEALWAPPGGQEREVPVCAADAARLADGEEPDAREVLVGGRATPYYAAPAYFGPWAGGFYGGGGMLLPGLLAGTLLGGSLFGPGVAFGGGWDGDGDGAGGDFGGGDGGGFDVGGGDFGGGDFGGGGDF